MFTYDYILYTTQQSTVVFLQLRHNTQDSWEMTPLREPLLLGSVDEKLSKGGLTSKCTLFHFFNFLKCSDSHNNPYVTLRLTIQHSCCTESNWPEVTNHNSRVAICCLWPSICTNNNDSWTHFGKTNHSYKECCRLQARSLTLK